FGRIVARPRLLKKTTSVQRRRPADGRHRLLDPNRALVANPKSLRRRSPSPNDQAAVSVSPRDTDRHRDPRATQGRYRPRTARSTARGRNNPAGRLNVSRVLRDRARPPPPTGQPWPPQGYGPEPTAAPPPPLASYADRMRADDLVPARKVPPSRGWRF